VSYYGLFIHIDSYRRQLEHYISAIISAFSDYWRARALHRANFAFADESLVDRGSDAMSAMRVDLNQDDIDADSVRVLLDFLYTGHSSFTHQQCRLVLALVDKWRVSSITDSLCFSILKSAQQSHMDLKNLIWRMKIMAEFPGLDKWQQMLVSDIIQHSNFACSRLTQALCLLNQVSEFDVQQFFPFHFLEALLHAFNNPDVIVVDVCRTNDDLLCLLAAWLSAESRKTGSELCNRWHSISPLVNFSLSSSEIRRFVEEQLKILGLPTVQIMIRSLQYRVIELPNSLQHVCQPGSLLGWAGGKFYWWNSSLQHIAVSDRDTDQSIAPVRPQRATVFQLPSSDVAACALIDNSPEGISILFGHRDGTLSRAVPGFDSHFPFSHRSLPGVRGAAITAMLPLQCVSERISSFCVSGWLLCGCQDGNILLYSWNQDFGDEINSEGTDWLKFKAILTGHDAAIIAVKARPITEAHSLLAAAEPVEYQVFSLSSDGVICEWRLTLPIPASFSASTTKPLHSIQFTDSSIRKLAISANGFVVAASITRTSRAIQLWNFSSTNQEPSLVSTLPFSGSCVVDLCFLPSADPTSTLDIAVLTRTNFFIYRASFHSSNDAADLDLSLSIVRQKWATEPVFSAPAVSVRWSIVFELVIAQSPLDRDSQLAYEVKVLDKYVLLYTAALGRPDSVRCIAVQFNASQDCVCT
jgi:hypothetical protein